MAPWCLHFVGLRCLPFAAGQKYVAIARAEQFLVPLARRHAHNCRMVTQGAIVEFRQALDAALKIGTYRERPERAMLAHLAFLLLSQRDEASNIFDAGPGKKE